MTLSQKITLRLSEIRQRLNEIAGLEGDAMTDEIRNEADKLTGEYRDKETQHRAAVVAEADEERSARGELGNGDGQPAEIRALMGRVSLGTYLSRAAAGIGLSGAPVELAAALNVPAVGASGGVALPWEVLAGQPEQRAFTDTGSLDGPEMQRTILARIFGPGVFDQLGVRIDSVPTGRVEWPLIATGVSPAMKVEGMAADAAVETTFTTEVLKPKRLTGAIEWTHEVSAQVTGLEEALRRDLQDAVRSAMSNQIVNGDEAASPEQVDGFATTIAVPSDSTPEATYKDYAGSHALAVDGLHAGAENEVRSVIGVDVYRHAAGVIAAGSSESGSEALRRRSGGCMASTYVGSATGGQAKLNIFHAAGMAGGGLMRGDSISAVWPTLEVVRDIYSQASQGVKLTWVSLWDAQTAFRSGAYKRLAFKIS